MPVTFVQYNMHLSLSEYTCADTTVTHKVHKLFTNCLDSDNMTLLSAVLGGSLM